MRVALGSVGRPGSEGNRRWHEEGNLRSFAAFTVCPLPFQMIVTDIYNHRFHRIFAANENLSSIMDRDDIYV